MISSISGFLNLNNLDMTSDANDVIVVRHPDGRLHSTPFNVRFGKVKVLRPSEKVVLVEVNGEKTSAVMKMGADGEVFWLRPNGAGDGFAPESPIGSPIPSAYAAPLAPTPHIPPATELPSADGGASSHNTPLIEADDDGHVKVSAAARRSLKDETEVHLAEEAVEAAERAMRSIAQMSFTNDDFLRETALREDGLHSVGAERPSEVFKSALDMTELEGTARDDLNAARRQETVSVRIGAPEVDNGRTPHPVQEKRANVATTSSISLTQEQRAEMDRNGSGAGQDDERRDVRRSSDGDHHIEALSFPRESVTDAASDVPSDNACSLLADDYLFEDAMGPDDDDLLFHANNEADMCDLPDQSTDVPFITVDANGNGTVPSDPATLYRGDNFESNEEDDFEKLPNHSDGLKYFVRTLVPTDTDLLKLKLKDGHNRVRYITHSSLRGEVAVEANVYLWDYTDRLVVSDVDGTVTKSDVWGHLMPLIGRDWTHPGICSLYSKISQNGYRFVYLTARSVSQISMTRRFLWNIEQEGYRLPKGPVLTAPQRFFTALTLEVSKKSHLFKIACLKSVMETFPSNKRPFYAGFGNRINDVISYAAVHIPYHKIFIIDPNSVLHVYNVKQTYKDLTHLVDVTFPPVVRRRGHMSQSLVMDTTRNCTASSSAQSPPTPDAFSTDVASCESARSAVPTKPANPNSGRASGYQSPFLPHQGQKPTTAVLAGSPEVVSITANDFLMSPSDDAALSNETVAIQTQACSLKDDVCVEQEFDSFLYWRVPPNALVSDTSKPAEPIGGTKPRNKRRWLAFSLGTGRNTADANTKSKSNSPAITFGASSGTKSPDPRETALMHGMQMDAVLPPSVANAEMRAKMDERRAARRSETTTTTAPGAQTSPRGTPKGHSQANVSPGKENSTRGWLFWKSDAFNSQDDVREEMEKSRQAGTSLNDVK